jgi:TniQ
VDTVQIADPVWETTFPHRVAPRPEEGLAGIFLRCDEVNDWESGTTMKTFVRALRLDKTARSMNLVLPPPSMDLRPLAGWLAVSEQSLRATTYHVELSRLYETPHPHPQLFSATGTGPQFCPACLAKERMLRRTFLLPHVHCCPLHHLRLQCVCDCSKSLSPPKTGFRALDLLAKVSYETGVIQRWFSPEKKPFTCHACGLDWAHFPRVEADPKLLMRERAILAWYDFFFSKGTLRAINQALQAIGRTLEQRQTKNVKRLNGSMLRVTFTTAEKTSLGRLVEVLVSLELSPDIVEAEEPAVVWRPMNRQAFYCPMPSCPHMKSNNAPCEARRSGR